MLEKAAWWGKEISIPYGSIKSLRVVPILSDRYAFQFLMVRLKGAIRARSAAQSPRISIPYGSIKSRWS